MLSSKNKIVTVRKRCLLLQKFVFYLTKVKETAEEFWEECGTLPGVYPGKIRGKVEVHVVNAMSRVVWGWILETIVTPFADCIPTEGLALKDWVKQTFNIQVSIPHFPQQ